MTRDDVRHDKSPRSPSVAHIVAGAGRSSPPRRPPFDLALAGAGPTALRWDTAVGQWLAELLSATARRGAAVGGQDRRGDGASPACTWGELRLRQGRFVEAVELISEAMLAGCVTSRWGS
ncbi:hypothetical protein GCM10023322_43500 [Rugosimonospora acidiphila]|uniref:Uncharacterized protein n=1 Tax=Rugosimonospora acidiphila TaxID=556531 RepID=A0ABP9S2U2_9ACTN